MSRTSQTPAHTARNLLVIKKRKSFLKNILDGMANIMPQHPRQYINPDNGGFSADYRAIGSDFGNIASDMKKAMRKYEQTKAN